MSLNVGNVFLLRNFSLSGKDPHYHVVIHKTQPNLIVTCYITSDEGRKTYKACRRDEEDLPDHAEPMTYVEVKPIDCPCAVTYDSCINCNKIQMKPEDEYENGPDFRLEKNCVMNQRVIKEVLEGIPYSTTVSDIIRNALP